MIFITKICQFNHASQCLFIIIIEISVDTNGFANDLITFQNQNDVLTLLIHLGYLAYDEETQNVCIPNEKGQPDNFFLLSGEWLLLQTGSISIQ